MKTKTVDAYRTTFHRDGSITVWNVYTQQWDRTACPSDEVMASLSYEERERVRRHIAKAR